MFSYYRDEGDRTKIIDMKDVRKQKHTVTYEIILKEDTNVNLQEKNELNQTMRIDSIRIEKKKVDNKETLQEVKSRL